MTDIQILQLLGLAYLAAGLGGITSPQVFKKAVRDYAENLPAIYLSAVLLLVLGYVLVNRSPEPCSPTTLLVTAIGWLCLIKGALLLAFPRIHVLVAKYVKKDSQLSLGAIISVLIGIALLLISF